MVWYGPSNVILISNQTIWVFIYLRAEPEKQDASKCTLHTQQSLEPFSTFCLSLSLNTPFFSNFRIYSRRKIWSQESSSKLNDRSFFLVLPQFLTKQRAYPMAKMSINVSLCLALIVCLKLFLLLICLIFVYHLLLLLQRKRRSNKLIQMWSICFIFPTLDVPKHPPYPLQEVGQRWLYSSDVSLWVLSTE